MATKTRLPFSWKCRKCGFENYYNKTVCYNCATRRKLM